MIAMFKNFTFHSFKNIFPYLILSIVAALVVNMYFYKMEVERNTEAIVNTEQTFEELKWKFVSVIIEEEYRAAGIQSKLIAERIDRDLKKEYVDMNTLKEELDNPMKIKDPKYLIIFKKNISSMYFYNVKNDNNDPFVAGRDGILMDLSLNCSSDGEPRKWSTEIGIHSNPVLATDSIRKILLKSPDIKFWEFTKHSDNQHLIIAESSMNNLKVLFMKEGLYGLKNIEFLAPTYITETGDIFGIDDIDDNGSRSKNHKFVVVQGFNVYDQIMDKHHYAFMFFDERKNESIKSIRSIMFIRNIVTVSISIIIILIAFILMGVNNRVFHDKGFCPCDGESQKEDDRCT